MRGGSPSQLLRRLLLVRLRRGEAVSPREAWRALLDADQALLALPRKDRKRSPEALAAAEARVDFVLALQAVR